MEDRFDNKDFERFVKQNADQYRMFPYGTVFIMLFIAVQNGMAWVLFFCYLQPELLRLSCFGILHRKNRCLQLTII